MGPNGPKGDRGYPGSVSFALKGEPGLAGELEDTK